MTITFHGFIFPHHPKTKTKNPVKFVGLSQNYKKIYDGPPKMTSTKKKKKKDPVILFFF